MKKGLVMEGGAMRCMFTAGVIDTLMKKKLSLMEQLVFQLEQHLVAIISQGK